MPRPHAWQQDAACLGEDTDLFFSDHPADQRWAIGTYCARCPVAPDCLAHALTTQGAHPNGIWGGTTGRQRAEQRRQQNRKATA